MEQKTNEASKTGKARFNIIDALIVIILLACIVGLVFRYGNFGGGVSEDDLDNYEIYFAVKNIAYTSENAFVSGDTVTLVDGGEILGTLSRLDTVLPAELIVRDKSGNLITVNYPESTRIDVTGYIDSRGSMGENGYLVDGTTYVAAGKEYAVQTEHADVILEILNIAKK